MVAVATQLDTPAARSIGRLPVATSARLGRVGTSLVLLAVVYAALSQGAFYAAQLRLVTVLVLVALAVTLVATGLSVGDLGAPTLAAAVLGAWYLVGGAVADDMRGALPAVELLAVLAATVAIVRRADEHER